MEQGRHRQTWLPRGARLGPFCPQERETEAHFLLQCMRDEERRGEMIRGGRVCNILMYTWTEEWIERLSEGAAGSRVDMNPGFHIIEGDQTLIVINKHPHLLELSSQREKDKRVIIK
ncbi:unnamed protein product [Boreogadus saida]